MLGLKLYATTATQVFKRVTLGTCHAVRSSSSTAVETAPTASSAAQSGSEIAGKEAKVTGNQSAENVKKQKRR